ncbi:MAG: 2-oxoacid:ferredoxin oxidoreductase subunit beta [Actinomycetota bacterium]|nr:MAG: 2-oxoacid:ferredoxin oxidoreductase subunit beta [Actinomycetota bacterium]
MNTKLSTEAPERVPIFGEQKRLLRHAMMPHMLCPGCGHGIVLDAMLSVLSERYENLDNVAFVGGIGCSSRIVGYIDACTLHTTHGRPLSFATGLKLARPDLNVIVITGDGDGLSIGGNHLIHAARRNIDITCVLLNNEIYGMTGGQVAPTTVPGAYTSTTPQGNTQHAFDAAELVKAAGATFVARASSYRPKVVGDIFGQAMDHVGFSFVEVMSDCTEYFGRTNRFGDGSDMLVSQARYDPSIDADLASRPVIEGLTNPQPVRPVLPKGVLHRSSRLTFEETLNVKGGRCSGDNELELLGVDPGRGN